MNANLSLMYFSHLDCVGYTGFSQDKMTTLVRRNYSAPINLVPSNSNCPASNKYSIILSEMIRYRRLCSNQHFVSVNEKQLFTELIKAGYKMADLKKQFEKSREHIKINYTEDTIEKRNQKEDFDDNFCGKIIFDQYSGSHKLLKTLLSGTEKCRIKPVLVPSFKIKTYLISRRKHLKRLRDFFNHE